MKRGNCFKGMSIDTSEIGGGEVLSSIRLYKIPVVIAGEECFIKTDCVKSDNPMILSLTSEASYHDNNAPAVWVLQTSIDGREVKDRRPGS